LRLGRPPRWLLAVIAAVLVAGGTATAIAAHPGRPGAAGHTGPDAQAAGLRSACIAFPRRDKRPVSTVRIPDCLPSVAGPSGLQLPLTMICVALPVRGGPGSVTVRPGTLRRRCFPGMA
jgi:hypothetical protein